jgi:hypothetical protein
LIGGTGMPPGHHEARIDHENVTKAADVSVAVPGLMLVAHRPE